MNRLVMVMMLIGTTVLFAKTPANPGMSHPPAKELSPIEREFHTPEAPAPRLSESGPMTMPSRNRSDDSAGMPMFPWIFTMPLGHAAPGIWIVR